MPSLTIPPQTELIGITLTIQPQTDIQLHPQYTTALHGWFLDCIRRTNPTLSQQLHDGQAEKPFTISGFQGEIPTFNRQLLLTFDRSYQWQITALTAPVCDWLREWLKSPPHALRLNSSTCNITNWQITTPATTYTEIWHQATISTTLELTFTSPTSFRKRKNHLPLPIPENVFQSYLRRWNHFATPQFNQAEFLEWVNNNVVILRHDIRSQKVQAGKSGSVTGFIGKVQFGLTTAAQQNPEFQQLATALINAAPYFNTGHKVTFGLGQTQLGWLDEVKSSVSVALPQPVVSAIAKPAKKTRQQLTPPKPQQPTLAREQELATIFRSHKKRQGGDRASKTAKLWAQIIARLEADASLKSISIELQIPYDTAKKYAQLAKKQLEANDDLTTTLASDRLN